MPSPWWHWPSWHTKDCSTGLGFPHHVTANSRLSDSVRTADGSLPSLEKSRCPESSRRASRRSLNSPKPCRFTMTHLFSDVNAFRHDPLGLFKRHSYPGCEPLVRLRLGPTPVYLVTDAALAKAVLKTDESAIDKGRLVQKLRTGIGTSAITFTGNQHYWRRAVVPQ